jgi:hypothetical protein
VWVCSLEELKTYEVTEHASVVLRQRGLNVAYPMLDLLSKSLAPPTE